jgi:methionyl-tRNA formyltransferase
MGAPLMVETLEKLEAGTIKSGKQDDALATLAPILKREDGLVDFTRPAMQIYNRWRGFQPWPGAYTHLHDKKLVLHRVIPMELRGEQSSPAEMRVESGRLFVGCGENSRIEIFEVQLEGKKRIPVADFLRGYQLKSGDRLG